MVVSVTDSASPSNALDAAVPRRRLHILECLYQQAGWGIAIGDCRTDVLQDIGPGFCGHAWLCGGKLVGQPLEQVFPARAWRRPRHRLPWPTSVRHHLFESVHVRRDGSEFPVLIDVTVVFDQ